jgi:hypothetical protein
MTETPHIFFEKGKGWFFLDEASFFHGYWKTKQEAGELKWQDLD